MSLPAIIAGPRALRIQSLVVEGNRILCYAVSTAPGAACPQCGQRSTRVHSRYSRRFRDPPWRQTPVELVVQVRRFFCGTPACPQRIFAERLPWAPPYARRSRDFTHGVVQLGWMHSAEGAAALATAAGYPVSPDTVLRLLRQGGEPEPETPRVLGVDDWAWRKGHRYGTVLVDLETHRIVDVLPDRRAATLAMWLAAHPGVKVVTRDRSGAYAQGIATGAPEAQQVADRWHLLQNLATAVDAWLATWRPPAAEAGAEPPPAAAESAPAGTEAPARVSPAVARRRARWEEIHRRRAQGASVSAIARDLGLDRATVRAYLAHSTLPGPPAPRVRGRLAAWFQQFEAWYAGGARTGQALWACAQAAGFPGSRSTIYEWLRRFHPTPTSRRRLPSVPPPPATAPPWLQQACCQPWARLPRAWDRLLSAWLAADATFRRGWTLVRHFVTLVRHRCGQALAAWVRAAKASGIAALAQFARSLRQDWAAVQAAVREPWSQGPVEAAVTGIKRLRRLMQGRGRWDLVRRRILHGLRLDPVPGQAS